MADLFAAIAEIIHATVPDFVRLPNLTFALPHAAYWAGILVFPLVAMYLVKREQERSRKRDEPAPASLALAYLLWLWGGIAGLHRFYLKSHKLGFVYVALFVGILYGNKRGAVALDGLSKARNDVSIAEFDVERFRIAIEKGVEGATEKLAKAEQFLTQAQAQLVDAATMLDQWLAFSGTLAYVIAGLLLYDAISMRRLRQRCLELKETLAPIEEVQVIERGVGADPRRDIHTPFTDFVGRINRWVGEYIAYWSVIAVFVYFYEVMARYVFNSPTNWAHESMFLMFGMQYLLAGGYALLEDSHVRVDVIYEHLGERWKAITDVITSFFLFVFTVTLLITGAIFALDAIDVWEVSFTEWAIQYWPVKITIALGALLITAQGLAKLVRDVTFLRRYEG